MNDSSTNPEPPKAKGCIILLALGCLVLLAGWLFPPLQLMGCAVTPSRLIGQVLDQDGKPIPEATIIIRRHLSPLSEKGDKSTTASDASGRFSYYGVHGFFLFISANKEGYYPVHEDLPERGLSRSERSFGQFDGGFPNPKHPEVFHLFRPPTPETLIPQRSRDYLIARDGSPIVARLNPSDFGPQPEIELRCWTSVPKGQESRRYEWHAEIRPRNGTLVRRKDPFDLIAPTDGYTPVIEIKMPVHIDQDVNPQWSSDVEVDAFYHFEGDFYARAKVRFIAGGGHFVVFESQLNPKTGSRNLSTLPKP